MTWRPAARPGAALLGIVLVLGALAASPPGVSAPPAESGSAEVRTGSDLVESTTLASPSEADDVRDYWTRSRMEAARPLVLDPGGARLAPATPSGRTTARAAARAALTAPRSVGKLFFTMPLGDAVCSAAAVNTAQRDVVITAAHCAHSGDGECTLLGCRPGAYFTNFLFVPRYANGAAPDGRWVGSRAITHAEWVDSEDVGRDQALIEVLPRGGRQLVDVVGGNGLAWNYPAREADVSVWGWPAESPYDGETVQACTGQTGPFEGTPDAGIACPMTGGSSGGPWFLAMVHRDVGFIWAVTSRRTIGTRRAALIARPLDGSIVHLLRTADARRPVAPRATAGGAAERAGRVRLRAAHRHVGRGQVVQLRVRAPARSRVVVDIRKARRGKWRRVAVGRTGSARVVRFTFRARKAGLRRYRVRAVGRVAGPLRVRVHPCPFPLDRSSAVVRATRCTTPSR